MEPHRARSPRRSNNEGPEREYNDKDKSHEDPMGLGNVRDQRKILEDDVWVYARRELAIGGDSSTRWWSALGRHGVKASVYSNCTKGTGETFY